MTGYINDANGDSVAISRDDVPHIRDTSKGEMINLCASSHCSCAVEENYAKSLAKLAKSASNWGTKG